MDDDRLFCDQANAVGRGLVTAKHVGFWSEIEPDLMIGAGQRGRWNAEPRARDGSVDVSVEEMSYIAVLPQQLPERRWILQHAIVERADPDLEGRVVEKNINRLVRVFVELAFQPS